MCNGPEPDVVRGRRVMKWRPSYGAMEHPLRGYIMQSGIPAAWWSEHSAITKIEKLSKFRGLGDLPILLGGDPQNKGQRLLKQGDWLALP